MWHGPSDRLQLQHPGTFRSQSLSSPEESILEESINSHSEEYYYLLPTRHVKNRHKVYSMIYYYIGNPKSCVLFLLLNDVVEFLMQQLG